LIFGLAYPRSCPNVPSDILSPRDSWRDKEAYFAQANKLAEAFAENFKQYEAEMDIKILEAAPKVQIVSL